MILRIIPPRIFRARRSGATFIAAEAALNQAFADGTVTQTGLKDAVVAAGTARSALRLVHLSRHLMTIDILTPDQIQRYNLLRGYSDDPCASFPSGHNAAMWRRHNGCED